MALTRITFTGIDENCALAELIGLARREPRLEFGILYQGPDQPSEPRYPQRPWIVETAARLAQAGVPLALHVCKDSVLNGITFRETLPALEHFGRMQLNKRISDEHLKDLSCFLDKVNPIKVITQEPVNSGLHLKISAPNHQIVFDASGGRGVLSENWPEPIAGHDCGYAGGLGPDTMSRALPAIFNASKGRDFWIDMETGIRDAHDEFSISRATQTLERILEVEAART